MEQLSWTDDMMLRAEKPETPMQIQMLLIYDQSTAPAGRVTFKRILGEIDARLHLAPTFRRRLTELPGGLHMPYWVDDPNFVSASLLPRLRRLYAERVPGDAQRRRMTHCPLV